LLIVEVTLGDFGVTFFFSTKGESLID